MVMLLGSEGDFLQSEGGMTWNDRALAELDEVLRVQPATHHR